MKQEVILTEKEWEAVTRYINMTIEDVTYRVVMAKEFVKEMETDPTYTVVEKQIVEKSIDAQADLIDKMKNLERTVNERQKK